MAEEFWLSDGQWARLAPLLPNKPRGVPRVDDRRVISGIIHVLKSGGRWADAPSSYGPRKTLYNRFVRWAAKGVWNDLFEMLATAGGPPANLLLDSSAVKAHRCAGGGKGGSGAFLLTGGQAVDCQAAERLLERVPPGVVVHADKGYDTDRVRQLIESLGSAPNIPPRSHRRWKNCFSPYLYRGRNAIERMFGRLKDFRRIATRYDRLARNYLAAVVLAATISYWL